MLNFLRSWINVVAWSISLLQTKPLLVGPLWARGRILRQKYLKAIFSPKQGSTFKTQEDFLDLLVAREFTLEHLGLQEKESPYTNGFNGGPKDPATWSPAEKLSDEKMSVLYNKNQCYFEASIPWKFEHDLNLNGNFRRQTSPTSISHRV